MFNCGDLAVLGFNFDCHRVNSQIKKTPNFPVLLYDRAILCIQYLSQEVAEEEEEEEEAVQLLNQREIHTFLWLAASYCNY